MADTAFPTTTVRGVCPHDCPDACGWVVTVEQRPEGRVPVALRGDPDHPYSAGELCPKVNRFLERAMSADRVLTPLRRVGPKGAGQFERITWAQALKEIAGRWREILDRDGPGAIVPFRSAGNQSELASRFGQRLFAHLGTAMLEGSVCGATAGAGTALTYGSGQADDPRELRFANTIVLWGNNTRLTNRHLWAFVEEARSRGATLVVVDALRTLTADAADQFVQPLPGTDVALMLAVMHVLIEDDLIDHIYVGEHASGFDELAAVARRWTPAEAAAVCGLSPKEIVALARRMADGPTFIRTLIGPEHAEHGATFFRTLAMLPVLLGAWKQRGGGFARSVGTYTEDALVPVTRAEHAPRGFARILQVNHLGRWLNEADPPVRSLLVWGANPVVTIPNSTLIRRGLLREDLFTVVHEQFVTDTVRYADIVLPATTQIEADDVNPSWGSPHVNYNRAAIAPRGEAVSNTEMFRRLAHALGLTEPALLASDEELLDELCPADGPVPLARLRAEGTVEVPIGPQRYQHGGFATTDGKAHLASPEAEALGLGRVPDWRPAHEGVGGDGDLARRFPFLLLTPKTHVRFLNSSYSQLPGHADREGGPFVEVSPGDAARLGLQDGVTAVVENDRCSLTLAVRVSRRVRDGVVAIPYGWAAGAHVDGNTANTLTNDTIVNHGGSVSYGDTRVAVRPAASG